ncbi:MAG: histidine kinase [Ginsengibacter sp.]
MYKLLLLILAFIVLLNKSMGQTINEKDFTHYTTMSGLSDNFITGITQDDFGFIWISTTNGLNRFDGKEIKRIYQTPGKKGLISDRLNSVKAIGNKLIIYSQKGAEWIDITKNNFIKLTVSEKQPVASFQNGIYNGVVLNNHICFVSTFTGAYAFDSTGKIIFRHDQYTPDSNGNIIGKSYGREVVLLDQYRVLHFDRDYTMSVYDSRDNSFLPVEAYKSLPGLNSLKGCMYIKGQVFKGKLIFFNYHSNELFIYDTKKDLVTKALLPAWFVKYINWSSYCLAITDSTAILYSYYLGVYKLGFNTAKLQLSYDTVPLFNKFTFTAAFLDRENRLWLGTQNGLFRQNIKQSPLHSVKPTAFNSPAVGYSISFTSFLRSDGLIYTGSYSTLPINVLDGKTYKVKKQISFSNLSPFCNTIWKIIEYTKDTLWFGTQDGIVWYDQRSENFDLVDMSNIDTNHARTITLLYKDSHGIIWLQTGWGAGITRYDPITKTAKKYSIYDKKNFLPLHVVNFIAEDKQKNIWLGEKGLTRWNREKEKFDTLITNYYGFNKDNTILSSLTNDENGDLIFCNENNGVLMYDPVLKTYKQLSTANGLQENAAYSAMSSNNNIWIVTHNYITSINKKTSKAASYSYADSMPATLSNALYHDTVSHRILIGFDNEIIWTDDTITRSVVKPISFYIDEFIVVEDTTILFPGDNIRLRYSQNDITIHYSAINFDEAASNRYAYRVNQKEWSSLGSENSIHFSNLSPGKYEVEIKYYAASNINSETIRKITFVVQAPFWNQWWFFVLLSVVIISIIYSLAHKRISEIRQKERVNRLMAEYEMKALHSQMNPHFIFNCLNSIREMILNNDNSNASHYLSKFAHLIRITLNNSSKPFISLQKTIEYLQRYLEMEQIRTTNFSYQINVDEAIQTQSTFLPPMLIQPFIENAIWHGASAVNQLIAINISFMYQNNQLSCRVEDNGIGIEMSLKNKMEKGEQPDHHSLGIENVKQRILVLNEKYHLHSSVTIEDKSMLPAYNEPGTVVTIYLPFKNTEL